MRMRESRKRDKIDRSTGENAIVCVCTVKVILFSLAHTTPTQSHEILSLNNEEELEVIFG
jgi:hypothetical protein